MMDAILSGRSGAMLMDISATDVATMIQNGVTGRSGLSALDSFGFDLLESGGDEDLSEILTDESELLRDMADWVEMVEY